MKISREYYNIFKFFIEQLWDDGFWFSILTVCRAEKQKTFHLV